MGKNRADRLVDQAVVDTFVTSSMRDQVYRDPDHALEHLGRLMARLQSVGIVLPHGLPGLVRPFSLQDVTVEYRGSGLYKAAYRFQVPGGHQCTEIVVFRAMDLPQ